MRKYSMIIRPFLGIALVVAILVRQPIKASEGERLNPSIILQKNQQIFLAPATEGDQTGLFPNFQELYPGDIRVQTIELENRSAQVAEFYLVMKVAQQTTLDTSEIQLIKKLLYGGLLELKITTSEGTVLYEGPVGGNIKELEGLVDVGEPTSAIIGIGSLAPNYGVALALELRVSPAVDNAYQSLLAHVNWLIEARWTEGAGGGGGGITPTPEPTPEVSPEPSPDLEIEEEEIPGGGIIPEEELEEELGDEIIPGGGTNVEGEILPEEEGNDFEEIEIPDEHIPLGPIPDQSELPKTGDTFPVIPIALAAMAFLGIAIVTVTTSRKKVTK